MSPESPTDALQTLKLLHFHTSSTLLELHRLEAAHQLTIGNLLSELEKAPASTDVDAAVRALVVLSHTYKINYTSAVQGNLQLSSALPYGSSEFKARYLIN